MAKNLTAKDGDFIAKDILFNKLIEMKEINFNSTYGGFSNPPIFLDFFNIYSLIKISVIKDSSILEKMIDKTLLSMYKGGVYDHVGNGFFEYSKDKQWLIPSFNKSLFTNASAILAYSSMFKITKKHLYKEIAYKVISYLDSALFNNDYYNLRQYCDLVTFSNFYTFSYEEIYSIIGEKNILFYIYFDISTEGNFNKKNILNLIDKDLNLKPQIINSNNHYLNLLLSYRNKKTIPKIDKILSIKNNCLLSTALSYAANTFKDNTLLDKAKKIIDFSLNYEKKLNKDNPMLLEDYSFLIFASIEYYSASKNVYYLNKAFLLSNYAIKNYFSTKKHFFSDKKEHTLSYNDLNDLNGPNSNSIMISNLISITKIMKTNIFYSIINKSFDSIYPYLLNNPSNFETMIANLLRWLNLKI